LFLGLIGVGVEIQPPPPPPLPPTHTFAHQCVSLLSANVQPKGELAKSRDNAKIRQWWMKNFGFDVSAGFQTSSKKDAPGPGGKSKL
jgi:hypothetical protein